MFCCLFVVVVVVTVLVSIVIWTQNDKFSSCASFTFSERCGLKAPEMKALLTTLNTLNLLFKKRGWLFIDVSGSILPSFSELNAYNLCSIFLENFGNSAQYSTIPTRKHVDFNIEPRRESETCEWLTVCSPVKFTAINSILRVPWGYWNTLYMGSRWSWICYLTEKVERVKKWRAWTVTRWLLESTNGGCGGSFGEL